MERRQILKYTAWITGAAVAAPFATVMLSGCQTDVASQTDYIAAFFKENEWSLMRELVDTIIPKTDSPSASEVGVHQMVDHMLANVYNADDVKEYRMNIDHVFNYLKDKEDVKEACYFLLSKKEPFDQKAFDAFKDLRHQTIGSYLSTEEISKNYLNYLPVPGEYQACISLEEAGGKLWAI